MYRKKRKKTWNIYTATPNCFQNKIKWESDILAFILGEIL